MRLNLIFATDPNGVYACRNYSTPKITYDIPWSNKEDLQHFYKQTSRGKKNAMIMGRLTYESIKDIPSMKNREKIIITQQARSALNEKCFASLKDAIQYLTQGKYDNVFVIGGKGVWQEALIKYSFLIKNVYHTIIESNDTKYLAEKDVKKFIFKPDLYMFSNIDLINNSQIDGGTIYHYTYSEGITTDELKYLSLMRRILNEGEERPDRTGTGTLSIFSPSEIHYSLLDNTIPILTTKKVVWKKGLLELLWYISGGTSSKQLEAVGVNYWKGNSSREFLDSVGLTQNEEGDLGPLYGYQWRHWGAEYKGWRENYDGQGIDQLKNLIEGIKTNPYSRRHILSSWNVSILKEIALPPCHSFFQMYVSTDGYLDCKLYQRSCDIFLGCPLNILCYSALTHMIAHLTDLKPRKFIHSFGDVHIYKNHVEAVKKQLSRNTMPFPKLYFKRKVNDIDDFKIDDFIVEDYYCHEFIKADMAV